jgi:hypothetical protein
VATTHARKLTQVELQDGMISISDLCYCLRDADYTSSGLAVEGHKYGQISDFREHMDCETIAC